MMTTLLTIAVILLLLLCIWIAVQLHRILRTFSYDQQTAIVNKILATSSTSLAEQSKLLMQSENDLIQNSMSFTRKSIEELVEKLHQDIADRQKEIRALEQDRNKSFAAIREAVEQHQTVTKELKTTTDMLTKVLSNNQLRGSWGEHIIEELLQSSGFVEGIHYRKQHTLGTGTDRPDITLLLPNHRVVPIDVKFPFAEITKYSLAESKAEKELHKKQFATDIKVKIKKVATYIRPEDETLDYALLFVPNEMVFSFINQHFPELIAEAMAQRVMIVSPFSLLIVARTIMESYRNFMLESNLKSIITHIGDFAKEWDRFISEFEDFGTHIGKMETQYRKIKDTRYKQMHSKIEHIQRLEKQGKIVPDVPLIPSDQQIST